MTEAPVAVPPAPASEEPAARPAAPPPTPTARGVCVGKSRDGRTFRLEGQSPADFLADVDQARIAWANFHVRTLETEGARIAHMLGFSSSLFEFLLRERQSAYEDRDTELGLLLPVDRVEGLDVQVHRLIVLVRRGFILTIHDGEKVTRFARFTRYADTYLRKLNPELPDADLITHVLIRILNESNDRNFDGLRAIEEHGDRLSAKLLDSNTPRDAIAPEIYNMKHALIVYLDTLWATLDVIQSLRFGDAELVTDDETLLARVGVLADDVNRQIQLSEHMSEVLASGLEVLQSIYNNELQKLNNRMAMITAYLTLIGTAVLVPNTIATIAATGVFRLGPEDRMLFLGVLVASTVFATWLSWVALRWFGVLPAKSARRQ